MTNVKLKKFSSLPSNNGAEVLCSVCGATVIFLKGHKLYPNKECWACKTIIANPFKLVDSQSERIKYHSKSRECHDSIKEKS